jgi:hypothetical protein
MVLISRGGVGNKIVFDPTNPSRRFLLHNSGTYEGIKAEATAGRVARC